MTVPPTGLFGFQLQDLDCFRKDEFAINTLLGNIANHAVSCKELRKLLEGTSAAITDVVVAVIAECDSILRRVFGSVNVVAQDFIRFASLIRRLPDICAIAVLELTNHSDGSVVHDEGRVLTVRTLQGIYQIKQVVCFERGSEGASNLATTSCSKEAERLADTSPVQERILLGIGEGLTEFLDDVVLQIESVVVEQLFSDLDGNMEFMGIEQNLRERRIRELKCATFFNPCCCRLSGGNIDFVFSGSSDGVAEVSHDVSVLQGFDETAVILFRNQITTIRIDTFLQNIADLAEVGAECGEHASLVSIGCTTGLGGLLHIRRRFQ